MVTISSPKISPLGIKIASEDESASLLSSSMVSGKFVISKKGSASVGTMTGLVVGSVFVWNIHCN